MGSRAFVTHPLGMRYATAGTGASQCSTRLYNVVSPLIQQTISVRRIDICIANVASHAPGHVTIPALLGSATTAQGKERENRARGRLLAGIRAKRALQLDSLPLSESFATFDWFESISLKREAAATPPVHLGKYCIIYSSISVYFPISSRRRSRQWQHAIYKWIHQLDVFALKGLWVARTPAIHRHREGWVNPMSMYGELWAKQGETMAILAC